MDSVQLFTLLRHSLNTKSLKLGKLIHQKIIILGHRNNISLCRNLISLYFSCKLFNSAELAVKSVDSPLNISLWNGLLASYTKTSMFSEALYLFEELLRVPNLNPDSYTYPNVLKACGGLGKGYVGKMIHTQVMKSGVLSDVVVASSVITMYAKCGVFESAVQVFNEILERDVACWNTLISCYYQNGQWEKALKLFEKMKELGFEPNSVTLTTGIASCARLLDLERGKKVHNQLVEMGIALDDYICSALVDLYGKCGCLDMAMEIFEKIPKKSEVSWNSIIGGYSGIGDSYSCIKLFRRMREDSGIKVNSTTLSSIVMACSKSSNLRHGKFVHGYLIRNHEEGDIHVSSSLLDLYIKCGSICSAEHAFGKMSKSNVVIWNVMISGYVSMGCYFEALRIFTNMEELGVKPDPITFTSILPACSQLASLEKGKEMHKKITENKLELNEKVMGAVLDMYSKCGAVDQALNIFSKLPVRDLFSWTSMITAYGNHGQASQALDLFDKMIRSNIKPDRVAFLAVISACSHAGLVDEGCYFFNLMTNNYGIEPTLEVYSCLIDLLARARRLHEAYNILKRINYNIKEDGIGMLSSYFSACHLHGESELGEEIVRFVIENNPNEPSAYVVLANIHASVKRWDEARKVRRKMNEVGLRKNPGCSWIEIGKKIQPFFVDDVNAQIAYDCLRSLDLHMEKERDELKL